MLDDAEALADGLHRTAGSDPSDPVGPEVLARRLWGAGAVRPHPKSFPLGDAMLTRVGGGWVIWVSRRLSIERRTFAIAHELAEWTIRERMDERIEDMADLLAAAIIAPRAAFLELHREVGLDLAELARTFEVTQTWAVLRALEATGRPGGVVSPPAVRARGADWGWPPERECRRLARCPVPPPEVERVPITDGRGRAALLALA